VGNRSYEVIAQEVSPDTWRKIKALDIPGVEPDQRTRRTYPAGTVAGNVLGFTHEGEHNRELIGARWPRVPVRSAFAFSASSGPSTAWT